MYNDNCYIYSSVDSETLRRVDHVLKNIYACSYLDL